MPWVAWPQFPRLYSRGSSLPPPLRLPTANSQQKRQAPGPAHSTGETSRFLKWQAEERGHSSPADSLGPAADVPGLGVPDCPKSWPLGARLRSGTNKGPQAHIQAFLIPSPPNSTNERHTKKSRLYCLINKLAQRGKGGVHRKPLALISQKLLLTVYKMKVTKSCKKQDQAKQKPMGRAQGTWRLKALGHGRGTGTWGLHPPLGHHRAHLFSSLPTYNSPKGHPRGAQTQGKAPPAVKQP